MSASSELKPCPFCGSPVTLQKNPMWRGTHGYRDCYEYDIQCGNPECRCRVYLGVNNTIYRSHEEAKMEAIEHWNNRKTNNYAE